MEERQIGTTELRQRLTDVIQAVKEEKVAYVVETFGRPQVIIVEVEAYRRLQSLKPQRAATAGLARSAFGMWADRGADRGAGREDMDDEWQGRSRQWYSTWQELEDSDE